MWWAVVLGVLAVLAVVIWLMIGRAATPRTPDEAAPDVVPPAPSGAQSSIYDNPTLRWSGNVGKPLPLKTLTYRQFDCLDDARQGFMILADLPSGTSGKTGDRVRFHAPRTVESLFKHGFLAEIAEQEAFRITDHGLYAVEACTVRY